MKFILVFTMAVCITYFGKACTNHPDPDYATSHSLVIQKIYPHDTIPSDTTHHGFILLDGYNTGNTYATGDSVHLNGGFELTSRPVKYDTVRVFRLVADTLSNIVGNNSIYNLFAIKLLRVMKEDLFFVPPTYLTLDKNPLPRGWIVFETFAY